MKKNILLKSMLCGIAMMGLSACSDFFEPENNTMLKGDDYIKEASEMYAGFLGVATKMQAIGDKAIYLTDSRAEMLIPTDRDVDMYALYNYESDLTGNTDADPAKYYDWIDHLMQRLPAENLRIQAGTFVQHRHGALQRIGCQHCKSKSMGLFHNGENL